MQHRNFSKNYAISEILTKILRNFVAEIFRENLRVSRDKIEQIDMNNIKSSTWTQLIPIQLTADTAESTEMFWKIHEQSL